MRILVHLLLLLIAGHGALWSAAENPADPRVEYASKAKALQDTVDGNLALATWCQRKDLTAEATKHLKRVIDIAPENLRARRLLGHEKIKGAWIHGEELAKAKGYVKHHGRWMPPREVQRIEARKKRFAEVSAKRADWANAWELKTPHFKIRSNCPAALVQEVAQAMELCHDQLAKIFKPRKAQIIPVDIFATPEQFIAGSAEAGIPVGPGVLGYFYYGSESGIRCFYAGSLERTLGTLFHEVTHLIIRNAYNEPPIWSNEGMAVFFEYARVGDAGLDIHSVPYDRLWHLRDQLKAGTVNLSELIQLGGSSEYGVEYYPQGWGMIHFLLYGSGGKYLPALQRYYEQKTRRGAIVDFKAAFGASPEDLTKTWEEYIAKLEPVTVDELMSAALAAIDYRGDGELAKGYAAKAIALATKDWRTMACEARVLLRLAWLENDREQATRALERFDAAFTSRPAAKAKKPNMRDLQIDYERGLACVIAGDTTRAISCANDILEKDELSASAYRLMALALATAPAEERNLDEARANLKTANDIGPGHENTYVQARIAEAEGKIDEALTHLTSAFNDDRFGFGAQLYPSEMLRLRAAHRQPDQSHPLSDDQGQ